MSKKRLYAHIILDASGSMDGIRATTISALNEYVSGLAADGGISSRISVTTFNAGKGNGVHTAALRVNAKAKEMPKLTVAEYIPAGGTPLYDAIGKVVAQIDAETRRENENVALVILTDGEENASKEFTKESIKALLDDRQANKNWLVIYLGANQDAFAEGAKFGAGALNTMSFEPQNVQATMRSAARGTASYASTGSTADAAFTDEERLAAAKK